ncbi:hypothetical protein VTN00DRAFT_7992 [Thermoascus crustaceus]|uniref:uncharacterized protein n=1 Tax=Thermoascus crustaceus TaxID=5088 RepID=UPI0037446661
MAPDHYPLSDVLAVAKVHPFYSDTKYPPTPEELHHVLRVSKDKGGNDLDLKSFSLTRKDALYKQIGRLTVDTDPSNGYRRNTYISTTGGGSGGPMMVFATDSVENRKQRAVIGSLMRTCGLIEPGDWVVTMHVSGHLYRALDLMTELMENAGAAVLCAGPEMSHQAVFDAIVHYRANVVAGDAGQLVQLANYISKLPAEQRSSLRLTKILYTSESMTPAQRTLLTSVLGDIVFCSVIGSAEAGPWAVASSALTGNTNENYMDFIFDTRTIHIEVLPLSIEEDPERKSLCQSDCIENVPDGEVGLIVQTSLQRLRNPLVRYVCGDIGSLHPLPQTAQAQLTAKDVQHYKMVRVYGRDRRISFDWYGEYFEFHTIQALMRTKEWAILQWQIILRHKDDSSVDVLLEIRIIRDPKNDGTQISEQELVGKIKDFFMVFDFNEDLFQLKFIPNFSGFERSTTGRKVMNFVDWTRGKQ